eukprot:613383-Rhodomonas_salina.3
MLRNLLMPLSQAVYPPPGVGIPTSDFNISESPSDAGHGARRVPRRRARAPLPVVPAYPGYPVSGPWTSTHWQGTMYLGHRSMAAGVCKT